MKVKKQQSATIETDWSRENRTVDDKNRLILDRTNTAKISHHCCHSNSKSKSKSNTKNSMRSTMKLLKLSDSLVHIFVLVVFIALFSSSSSIVVVVNAAPANNPANGLNVVKLPALYWNVNNRLFSDSNQVSFSSYLLLMSIKSCVKLSYPINLFYGQNLLKI